MPGTADVAVIGDGAIGASIAYHLAAAGAKVALLARSGGFRSSATRRSAGQVRMHHSDPHDARLAALGLETFEHWAEIIGGDCGFRRAGFAFLVDEDHAGVLARTVAELKGLGVETTVLTPDELADEQPALDLDGVAAVAYEPRSGYADPVRTAMALTEQARARGAEVLTGPGGVRLHRTGDRFAGAVLNGDLVSAEHIVVAAGVGSAALCAAAGVGLGTADGTGAPRALVHSKQVGWAVANTSTIPCAASLCMVIDDIAGTYFRPDGSGQVLFRVPLDGSQAPGDDTRIPRRSAEVAAARALAAPRLRGLTAAEVTTAARAAEAYTSDGRALIGPLAPHPGLYLATGFNGGGFKAAPAVGRAVAAELLSGVVRPELDPYRPDRFAAGEPVPIIQRYRNM
ncbi:oxidoreductase [Streptomyces albospinus]|uniref:Oxidoreductase n=1 Tax=Streptomyces albospinus TaxID=285515 RepID=A0ABQ2UNQ4_9ACTN|nr:FAD-binding oxidoreductase [Streptomyces albospinus]GGU44389.1 oxidoreductase [Streptomyces albospinus]